MSWKSLREARRYVLWALAAEILLLPLGLRRGALVAGTSLACLAFFRDPHRELPDDPDLVYAPADGVVVGVDREQDKWLGEEDAVRISTFLSIADVHVNRSPVAGEIVEAETVGGGYAPAFLGRADRNHRKRLAVEQNGLANWPALAGGDLRATGDGLIRVQWCHGAPGMVASLAALAPDDDEHDRLLRAGGELVWRAGPVAKGAGLCHGTAGNGYAFLALLDRTGDELWLERARAFAMHAAAQVARDRAAHGRGRFTLWTGDPGTALYLVDCLAGEGAVPLP
jgi:hypothetical protein